MRNVAAGLLSSESDSSVFAVFSVSSFGEDSEVGAFGICPNAVECKKPVLSTTAAKNVEIALASVGVVFMLG